MIMCMQTINSNDADYKIITYPASSVFLYEISLFSCKKKGKKKKNRISVNRAAITTYTGHYQGSHYTSLLHPITGLAMIRRHPAISQVHSNSRNIWVYAFFVQHKNTYTHCAMQGPFVYLLLQGFKNK